MSANLEAAPDNRPQVSIYLLNYPWGASLIVNQGTRYRAPEMWKGSIPSPKLDIWGLGVTLTNC